jgi:hypothetical protein
MKSQFYTSGMFTKVIKNFTGVISLALLLLAGNFCYGATVSVYPLSQSLWTGSVTSGGTKSASSVIYTKGGSNDRGWMKFDLSVIPQGATINSVTLKYYITNMYNPQLQFRKVTGDPVTLTGSTLWTQIGSGYNYLTVSVNSLGWNTRTFSGSQLAQLKTDLQAAINNNGWFALGMYCSDNYQSFYAYADGWNQQNKPYMIINYTSNLQNDISLDAITSPVNFACEDTLPITISISNAGTNAITSAMIIWSINSDTKPPITWTGNLASGGSTSFTLANYVFTPGNYIINITLANPNGVTDPFTVNNTKIALFQITPKPSVYQQPVNESIGVGGDASFTTVGSGGGITYQWQVSTDGGTTFSNVPLFSPYSNTTSSEMNITSATQNMNGYLFRCIVSGTCSPAAISDTVMLSVGPPVTLAVGKGYACTGQSAIIPVTAKDALNVLGMKLRLAFSSSNMLFNSVTYVNPIMNGSFVVTNVTDTIKINWTGVTPISLSNDTICKLSFTYLNNGPINFDTTTVNKSKITGSGGTIFPSHYKNGSLINASPVIVTQPANKLAITGTIVFFNVVISGTPTYQWQVSTDGGTNWSNLTNNVTYSGVNDDTLFVSNPTLAMNGYRYRCILNGCGNTVTSNAAIMSVMKLVRTWLDTIYDCTCFTPSRNILVPIHVSNFDSINSVSLSLVFKNSALQYDGYQYMNPALQFPVIFASPAGTGYTKIRLGSISTFGFMAIPENQPLAVLKFKVLCDTVKLQWETWTAGACQYSTGPDTAIYVFDAWFGDGFVLDGGPTISTNPVNQTVYAGDIATFSCSGTTQGATLVYQWQVSTDGGTTWTDLTNNSTYSGATSPILTVNASSTSMNGFKYRCKLDGLCDQQITTVATLTVNAPPIYVTIPPVISCQGDTIDVPINVQNFAGVCSLSLTLAYNNTQMSFLGISNVNGQLTNIPNFLANASNSKVLMSWFSTSPSTITGTSTLVVLRFTTTQLFTNSALTWVTSPPGSCSITNCSATPINTNYSGSTVSVNPIPVIHNVITPFPFAGHFCAGELGAQVSVDITQLGVNYALYRDGVVIPEYSGVAGTGFGITFNTFNVPGTYTVIAYYPLTGCSVQMDQFVIITVDAPPITYNVTGTGSFCTGGSGLPVGLSGSQLNVDYFLYLDGVVIDTVQGTGAPFTFPGLQTVAGTYTVMARNAIFETCPRNMNGSAVITINPYPDAAGPITGPPTNPCQGGTNYTYCVAAIANATSYQWNLPPGCNPISGTNSSCITVQFSNNATSGTMSVMGTNLCGEGTPSTLLINPSLLPGGAGAISGPDSVCPGTQATYTLGSVANATSYSWTYPGGFTGPSSTATPSATVTVGTLATSGTITVVGHNDCGNGTSNTKSVIVKALAGAAGTITGNPSPCQGLTYTYGVAPIANVTSSGYIWSYSGTGATLTVNANSVSIAFSTTATSGTLSVKGHNSCGDGTPSTLALNVSLLPAAAGTISGSVHVCKGSPYTYTLPVITGASTYTWSVPAGFTGTTVTTTPSATFTIGASAINGVISVTGTNGCGNGLPSNITVTVHNLPTPTLPNLGSVCLDAGPLTLTGGSPPGGVYSGTGVSDGNFNPAVSGTGTFTITYTYTDTYNCVGTVQNSITVVDYPTISGTVNYDNTVNTAMGNIKVRLKNNLNTLVLDSTISSIVVPYGQYSFRCLTPSTTYNLECTTTRAHMTNSCNAQDALKVIRYAVGLDTLSLLRKKAADVNNSNSVNSIDALKIIRRWAAMDTSFAAGNWVYSTVLNSTVAIQNSDVTKNIVALCYGDVNGSAVPGPVSKMAPSVTIEREGFMEVKNQKTIEIPVTVKTPLSAGSVSLALNYDDSEIQIVGVKSVLKDFIYNVLDGQARFAWYDLNPVKFNPGDPILSLVVKVKGRVSSPVTPSIQADECSLITDQEAVGFDKVFLSLPDIKITGDDPEENSGNEFFLRDNRPNPFNYITEISYSIPEDGEVRLSVVNLLGEEIKVLTHARQGKGSYTVKFNGSSFTPGMYMYKIDVRTSSTHYLKSHTMIITD